MVRSSGTFVEGVVLVPVCEKCGETYADMYGECPTCRARNKNRFFIWVLAIFVLTLVGFVAWRVIVLS